VAIIILYEKFKLSNCPHKAAERLICISNHKLLKDLMEIHKKRETPRTLLKNASSNLHIPKLPFIIHTEDFI